MWSVMKVYCPICRSEMDGMRSYGVSACCGAKCHNEWEWRKTLAILGKPYIPLAGERAEDGLPSNQERTE